METTNTTLSIQGTRLLLDGQPFFYQGLSFFSAVSSSAAGPARS